ncbi:MAG: hypothetical protein OXC30_05030, partial [Alphaproteobacteria bacterium]|nr:hypothetical protein [Alphaproteobacteria bacterium]
EGYCSRWCEKANLSMVENLILVDEFLIPIDLTGGVRAFPDSGSLGCDDKAVCSYEDQAPAPNDFMPRLENFIAAIQDTQRLTQEHLISVVACINSVDEIAQDEGSSDDHGSDLARLCEKSKLNKTLLNYKAYLSGALDAPMSKCLNMLTKCLEKERAFRSKENPLVVLQEESSEFTLHERLKNVRDNLDEFMKMEREISTRLKKLARCAPFFIEYKFKKYVRRFPQLGMDHVYWYDYVLRRQLAEFISTEDLLRRRAEGNFSDIVKAQKVLHDSDGDIVLPPIQVECDLQGNDLCGNLDIFVKILKEIELWEVRQSRQKESLQRSVFGVVCDQTAKATLGDKFSYIQALKQDLLGHLFRDQNKRRTMVDTQLFVLSEFLQLIISTEKNRSGLCRKRRFSAAFEKNRSGVCRKRRFAD